MLEATDIDPHHCEQLCLNFRIRCGAVLGKPQPLFAFNPTGPRMPKQGSIVLPTSSTSKKKTTSKMTENEEESVTKEQESKDDNQKVLKSNQRSPKKDASTDPIEVSGIESIN